MNYDRDAAAKWHKRYDLAATNQEPLFKKFAAWYDIANTVYPSDRKVAPWRSKVLFPTLGNKAWQLAAKFVGLKPGWAVKARLPFIPEDMPKEDLDALVSRLKDAEEKAQYKLEYDYDNPELDESMRAKLLAVMMDAIITGTGFGKAPWTVKNKVRYERVNDDLGGVDMTQEKVIEKVIGYNDFIPCTIFNVFVAPAARNLYNSPWVIIQEHKTLIELEDTNKANGGKFYQNLDQLKDAKADADRFAQYKASRNRIVAEDDPIAADKTVNQLPIFECYDLDKNSICWYAATGSSKESDWILLREEKNQYWHGKYPLISFYIKKKPHDFWGQGIFQTNERVDAAKNDIFNHYADNYNLSVDGGIIAEEDSIVNDYIVEPGFELTYTGTKPDQFKFPEPNPAQLTTVSTLLDRAIEDGTISPYSAGAPNSATDTTAGTKGGILAIQQQADDILSFGRENFRDSITQLGKFYLSNNQQFLDEPMTFAVDSSTGKQVVTVSPTSLQGEFDIEITEDSMEPLSRDQRRQVFEAAIAQLLSLQAASVQQSQFAPTKPLVYDFEDLAKDLMGNYGVKDSGRYILDEEEVAKMTQMAQMQQQDNLAGQPPGQSPGQLPATPTDPATLVDQPPAQSSQPAPANDADAEVAGMVDGLAQKGLLDRAVLTQQGA